MTDFGVIICTCKFDFFLAKACVASVRYSLGDVPITLFLDDDLDAGSFAKRSDVQVMYRREVRDLWLRTVNTGWGLPKMTLLWESPYERFLYLDCDTIVWGDVLRAHILPFATDFVIDPGDVAARPWCVAAGTNEKITQDYFDLERLEALFPNFPWQKYRAQYFCTGVWAARRGCLSLERYQEIMKLRMEWPGLFKSGEMAMLNFLIFEAEERCEITVKRAPIQTVCEWDNQDYLKKSFITRRDGPDLSKPAPTVLHFTDPKPLASSRGFNEPMEYFRERCASELLNVPSSLAPAFTRLEEMEWRLRVGYRRNLGGLHARVRSILKPSLAGP